MTAEVQVIALSTLAVAFVGVFGGFFFGYRYMMIRYEDLKERFLRQQTLAKLGREYLLKLLEETLYHELKSFKKAREKGGPAAFSLGKSGKKATPADWVFQALGCVFSEGNVDRDNEIKAIAEKLAKKLGLAYETVMGSSVDWPSTEKIVFF